MTVIQAASPGVLEDVLNPLGYQPEVEGKVMAQRLDSLHGKTVCLLDTRFDQADLVLEQLRGWFADNMPSVRIETVQMAAPLVPDPAALERVAATSDAAIVAMGHCSTCSPGVATQVLELEAEHGIPAVGIQSIYFKRLVDAHLRVNGMPTLRQVYLPHPVVGRSAQELRAYIDGDDASTGRPVMQEMIEALTGDLDDADLRGVSFTRSTPRYVEAGSEDELQRRFLTQGWTDQLPIVLPTEERVAAMLAGTSRRPDEVVARIRTTGFREASEVTVEKVAINAVMAGAAPEYLPVILALASSGISARPSTTTSMGTFVVVNGPIREQIAMNSGIGAFGPYNHANATIGRAYGLVSQNGQNGSVPGLSYMGSQGNIYNYPTLTFAENEEDSPWTPFHLDKGFQADQSTVSIFSGAWYTSHVRGMRKNRWKENLGHVVRGMNQFHAPVMCLDPVLARGFVEVGLDTKEKLVEVVYELAQLPAQDYWDQEDANTFLRPRAAVGLEPWATNAKASGDEPVHMFRREEIHIVVVGGGTMGTGRLIGADYNSASNSFGGRRPIGGTFGVDDWR